MNTSDAVEILEAMLGHQTRRVAEAIERAKRDRVRKAQHLAAAADYALEEEALRMALTTLQREVQ